MRKTRWIIALATGLCKARGFTAKLFLSIGLLGLLCLILPGSLRADSLLYDNGPINGTLNSFLIGVSGYQPFSDSFTVGSDSTLTVAQVGLWVPTGDTPTSVDWAIGTVMGGSDIASGTSIFFNQTKESTFVGFYDIWQSSLDIGGSVAAGTYWFSLQNGTESGGDALYWDMNNGPSIASANGQIFPTDSCFQVGGTCSESFQIYGSGPAPTPEPSSFLLLGTGLMGLAGVLRRLSHESRVKLCAIIRLNLQHNTRQLSASLH